jgi:hypothetical protein
MNFSKTLILAAVACVAPVVGFADSVAVTSNPSMSINGMTFSGFGCNVNYHGTAVSPSDCGGISVGTITQPGVGISFTSLFSANPDSKATVWDDAVLSYNVASKAAISAVGLDFNGYIEGHAITSVTESIYTDSNFVNQVGFAKVSCDKAGCTQVDNITLNGSYNDLFIKKDISVQATGSNSATQISYVDQTFTATPEPGSTALLGSGLLAIAGLLRRRAIKK